MWCGGRRGGVVKVKGLVEVELKMEMERTRRRTRLGR